VPFALRWIHAQLPEKLGVLSEHGERLYKLLDFCNRRLERAGKGVPFRGDIQQLDGTYVVV
jgi:trafficking protein particle complex subunit 12